MYCHAKLSKRLRYFFCNLTDPKPWCKQGSTNQGIFSAYITFRNSEHLFTVYTAYIIIYLHILHYVHIYNDINLELSPI